MQTYLNPRIAPAGASIGTPEMYWEPAVNYYGRVYTAFNDDYDSDNSGTFTQRIRIDPKASFAKEMRLRMNLSR
jgi:hypothetical protein